MVTSTRATSRDRAPAGPGPERARETRVSDTDRHVHDAEDRPLVLLHVDEHVVAIDKPAWSVVHPTRGARDALVLTRRLARELDGPVFPVHRLDRQTSGVLLLARTPAAARHLCDEFRAQRVRKTYLGLCRGTLDGVLVVDHPVREGDQLRPAVTAIEPIETFCSRYTLLRATPEGGRRHQIRCHLKHASHPLVGDVTYGKGLINRFFRQTFGLARLFLHAEGLVVAHPSGGLLELRASLPEELSAVLERLRRYREPVP